MSVEIRPFAVRDAATVGRLMEDLGYPAVNADTVLQRIAEMNAGASHAIFVACLDGTVRGWLHVVLVPNLIIGQYAEVATLVVDSTVHRSGLGRRLMAQAEAWAREQGVTSMRLRSGIRRSEAHQFYESMGYATKATSHTFDKAIAPAINERL